MTSRPQSLPEPGYPGPQQSMPVRRWLILWASITLSLVAIGAGVWQWWQNRQADAAPAPAVKLTEAVDFSLPSISGEQVQLSSLRGKVVLLNFWATWCPPCKAEMPDLNALYHDNGSAHDFVVVGVDLEEDQAAVAAFARQYGVAFPLVLDGNGTVTTGSYGLRALPTSILIDRQGKVRDMWAGQLSRAAMLARLERIW